MWQFGKYIVCNVRPLGDVADYGSLDFQLMTNFPSTKPTLN